MSIRRRVLIVDDSVVIRRLLSDVIGADPQLQVAGFAANGEIALAMLDQVSPDLVTLDVEMPVMDGLEALRAIRAKYKRLPVIMFSTLTERGAAATIDALTLGASDYVTKPANVGSFSVAKERVRDVLIPKIKALCGVTGMSGMGPAIAVKKSAIALRTGSEGSSRVEVLVIGSSTGGPNALEAVLRQLPPDFGLPILIVQHMPPAFTRFLAQRLSASTKLCVQEGFAGAGVVPGTVWVAPGDHHMAVVREGTTVKLSLNQDNPENSCRPSVDVLFRSAAEAYGRSTVVAAILTGMGQDGWRGCERLAEVGAHIVAQDEETSVVWGMPGFVAKAGLANAVLPLNGIASHIARHAVASRQRNVRAPALRAVGAS